MKKSILLLTIFVLSNSLIAQSNWTSVSSGVTTDLNRVHFTDDTNGFIIGDNGTLLRTTNGGTSWSSVSTDVNHNLYSIVFESATIGYINGLKTTNSGSSWTKMPSTNSFGAMHSGGANNLVGGNYVESFDGLLHRTTNGGTTWTTMDVIDGVFTGFYSDGYSLDVNTAYFVSWYSGHLVKTVDGGATWAENLDFRDLVIDAFGVNFSSPNVGVVVGNGSNKFIKTANGGDDWASVTPSNMNEFFTGRGVFCLSDEKYIVVGWDGDSGNDLNKIYETINGGTTWTGSTNITNDLYDVACTTNNCFAVGKGGTILKLDLGVLGLDESKIETAKIYPNPTLDVININFGQSNIEDYKLSLYDVAGKVIKIDKISSGKMDVSHLQSGMYILNITSQNKTQSHKIIKL